jgi:transposase
MRAAKRRKRRLWDAYAFPGFRPEGTVRGIFGAPKARIVRLKPRSKKTRCADCGRLHRGWYDRKVRRVRDLSCGDTRVYLEIEVRRVLCRASGKVRRERLAFLADNPLYTKRFATFVGRRCRVSTIKDVAKELRLDWETVKELDKQYMRAQLARAGTPAPKVIGIDEIAIRKGHTYRIVVSDLERRRPIWFGGSDRSEASMALFYDWLGPKKSQSIRLAVMDMWKPFRKVTAERAPKAAILFDKFHVMRHLGEALDAVRKSEYARLSGRQRRYIKGQKYTLLSRRENLSLDGRQALRALLKANKRLNVALRAQGVLRTALGLQTRDLGAEVLRQLALQPQVAALEELPEVRCHDRSPLGRHRRLLQVGEQGVPRLRRRAERQDPRPPRRAYGLRDEEYLRLKILTSMLPEL